MILSVVKKIGVEVNKSWQVAKSTNLYKGITQARPTAKIFNSLSHSASGKAILQQALYYNILLYLLPVVFINLLPCLIGLFFDVNSLWPFELLLSTVSKIYFAYIIAVMFVYNSVLAICASDVAAAESSNIDALEGKICECPKGQKFQQVIRGPLYYLSNQVFAKFIQHAIHPVVSWPLKINIYGQALFDVYLANTGACVQHRKEWLSTRNTLSIGCGIAFLFMQTFSESIIHYFINSSRLDLLSSFIINDSVANLLWLFFVYNIHINPTILLSSTEYSINLFKYNNDMVDTIYDMVKPKIKKFLANLRKNKPNIVLKYILTFIAKLSPFILPKIFTSPHDLLCSPPMQLFLNQNKSGLLRTLAWFKTIDRMSFIITSARFAPVQQRIKTFLKMWFPESVVNILIIAITKKYLSIKNIEWFERYINISSLIPLKRKMVIRMLTKIYDIVLKINHNIQQKKAIKEFTLLESPSSPISVRSFSDSEPDEQTAIRSPVVMISSPFHRAGGSVASEVDVLDMPVTRGADASSPSSPTITTIYTSDSGVYTVREQGDTLLISDQIGFEMILDGAEVQQAYSTVMRRF